ncbi:uncharacterized protein A4U43_C03F13160, partial [Asparagus officinalis]
KRGNFLGSPHSLGFSGFELERDELVVGEELVGGEHGDGIVEAIVEMEQDLDLDL